MSPARKIHRPPTVTRTTRRHGTGDGPNKPAPTTGTSPLPVSNVPFPPAPLTPASMPLTSACPGTARPYVRGPPTPMTRGSAGSWTPWTRRIGLTAATAIAAVTLAGPGTAQAATTTAAASASVSASVSAAAAEDVGYATWQQDCQAVMDQALPYLKQRIAAASKGEKPAIVFDIDNTALETDFGFSYPSPANAPVLKVAQYAQDHGVALFFVTARPDIIKPVTQYNLTYVGYNVTGLYVRNLIDLFKNVARLQDRAARRHRVQGLHDHRQHRQQRHRPVGRPRGEDVQAAGLRRPAVVGRQGMREGPVLESTGPSRSAAVPAGRPSGRSPQAIPGGSRLLAQVRSGTAGRLLDRRDVGQCRLLLTPEGEGRGLALALHVDDHDVTGAQLAEEDLLGERVLDLALDRATQRAGAQNGVVTLLGRAAPWRPGRARCPCPGP